MKKSKEQLKNEIGILKAHKQDLINGKDGQPCEVYSRIVGYYRDLSAFNKGRAQEFRDRVTYKIND